MEILVANVFFYEYKFKVENKTKTFTRHLGTYFLIIVIALVIVSLTFLLRPGIKGLIGNSNVIIRL